VRMCMCVRLQGFEVPGGGSSNNIVPMCVRAHVRACVLVCACVRACACRFRCAC